MTQVIGVGLGLTITGLSGLAYQLWSPYRKSANYYLGMPDLIWLGLLPGLSEELLFWGVMLPALGFDHAAVILWQRTIIAHKRFLCAMNNNSSNRLDRIERLLEGHGKAIAQHDQAMTQHDQAIARHEEAMAFMEDLLTRLGQRTDNIAIAVDCLANTQLQLAQIFDQERETTRATLGSINAALERIDRVMDYLLRQQNGNG